MELTEMVVIVLGLLAAFAGVLVAFVLVVRANSRTLAAFQAATQPALDALIGQADKALAGYGETLRPLNATLGALESLVNDPTDWLNKTIASGLKIEPDQVSTLLMNALQQAQDLTDGEVEPEVAKEGQFDDAVR